jgi:colanic acid/amylovoran biosynthesis glycosyltransferase
VKTVVDYIAGSYLSITETWIYGQIQNLSRYHPIVYAYRTENRDVYPLADIRSLGLKDGLGDLRTFINKGWNRLFGFYPGFLFFLRRDKPDLVHAHYGPSGYRFLRLKKMFRLPLITTFYGYDLSMLPKQSPSWKRKYKKLFRRGNVFLVEGSHMKESLIELGCSGEKIIVQHLGVDLEKITFMSRELAADNEIKVLIAGSFREKKGIPYAIEAIGRIKQSRPDISLRLTIIGDSSGREREEKQKEKILSAIQKHGLSDCVKMMGYQPHAVFISELYSHHLFLSPSVQASDGDTEGGAPVSIIEASASGMPVLSTIHCDIPEVVINGEGGYLVPERNIDALAERLEFLVINHEQWGKMGRAGRKHIVRNYDIKKQVRKLEGIYDDVSNRRYV